MKRVVLLLLCCVTGKIKDDPYGPLLKGKAQAARDPLSSVLTLDSHYFPDELFSSTEKRCVDLYLPYFVGLILADARPMPGLHCFRTAACLSKSPGPAF